MNADTAWYIMIFVLFFVPLVNFIIAPSLDKYTRPKNYLENDSEFLFLFFGIFCLTFLKKIKKSRLLFYLIDSYNIKVKEYNKLKHDMKFPLNRRNFDYEKEISKLENEMLKLDRKIKLIEIKK